MLQDELREIASPVLREVQDHPFWTGLRDGSLPGAALACFAEQDLGFLLPAYARALARCAASAPDDADAWLLSQSAAAALEARDGLREAYAALADELGVPPLRAEPPTSPVTCGYASFFAASTATSFYAGLGALLPMVWFNAEVTDVLKAEAKPESRYLRWIDAYHPGESYRHAVRAFSDMADCAGENCSARERELVIEQFSMSVRYELAFADSCLRQAPSPTGRSGGMRRQQERSGAG